MHSVQFTVNRAVLWTNSGQCIIYRLHSYTVDSAYFTHYGAVLWTVDTLQLESCTVDSGHLQLTGVNCEQCTPKSLQS